MLIVMGYRITEQALNAGREAIAAKRTRRFTSIEIGRAMEPMIRPSKQAWKDTSIARAATAAAEHLLWTEHKAGRVEALGLSFGRRCWKSAPARLQGSK